MGYQTGQGTNKRDGERGHQAFAENGRGGAWPVLTEVFPRPHSATDGERQGQAEEESEVGNKQVQGSKGVGTGVVSDENAIDDIGRG